MKSQDSKTNYLPGSGRGYWENQPPQQEGASYSTTGKYHDGYSHFTLIVIAYTQPQTQQTTYTAKNIKSNYPQMTSEYLHPGASFFAFAKFI